MKKFLKALLVCTLALVMILSLVSCDLFDKDDDDDDKDDKDGISMSDVIDELEDFTANSDVDCELSNVKLLVDQKVFKTSFEVCGEIKSSVKSFYELTVNDDVDPTSWCYIVEFKESADAKTVAGEIGAKVEEFNVTLFIEMSKSMLGDIYEDMADSVRVDSEDTAEECQPENVLVKRFDSIVVFGNEKVVSTVIEIIEDIK